MVHGFLKKSSNLVKTVKKIRPIAFKKNNLYRKIDCNTTYYLTDDLYHLYHDLFYPEIVYLYLRARGPYWQNVAHKTLESTDISKFLRCFVLVTVYIFINLYIIVSFQLNTRILSQVYNYVADSNFPSLFCNDKTITAANADKDITYGNGRSVFSEIFQNISSCRSKCLTLK